MIRKGTYTLLFPLDFAGTLCARDGIKTGPRTPNGEDAYDRKIVAMKIKRPRRMVQCFENHKSDSRVRPLDCAMTMGAERNSNASNDNPLVVTCFSGPQDHCVTRGYMEECAPTINAAAGMSGNNRPFIVKSCGINPIASRDPTIEGECSKTQTCDTGRNFAGVLTMTTPAIPINSMVIGKDGGNGDRQTFGIGEDGDPSPTLQAAHHHAVAVTRRTS